MKIEVSDATFERLQRLAVPLVDTVESVIIRLIDDAEGKQNMQPETRAKPRADVDRLVAEIVRKFGTPPVKDAALKGFQRELWEQVILKIPTDRFSLRDVYARQGVLKTGRPDVKEMEASIRHSLQVLRDKGFISFCSRGEYERIQKQ